MATDTATGTATHISLETDIHGPSATFGPLITRTPASPAECPSPNNDVALSFDPDETHQGVETKIIDFLSAGGSVYALNTYMEEVTETGMDMGTGYPFSGIAEFIHDLTGDNIPEIFLMMGYGRDKTIVVLKCEDDSYTSIYRENRDRFLQYPSIEAIQDFNANGVNELLITRIGGKGAYHWSEKAVLEWDGQELISVLLDGEMNLEVSLEILDLDHNGTLEFVFNFGPPYPCSVDPPSWFPWRNEYVTYAWNGMEYVEISRKLAPPEYRFQAVHAGDDASIEGDYEQALALYQQAIFDEALIAWSADLWRYRQHYCSGSGDQTPEPSPTPDPDERPRLSAYSRYRILLLHILRDDLASAAIVYNTLQSMHPAGTIGHPHAEMATAFWNEYNTSYDLKSACERARYFATAHAMEILSPLGIDFYGLGSRYYEPEDICPFG